MNATDTASEVVHWAIAPQGPPPRGYPAEAHLLAHPEPPLVGALAELTAVATARLRLSQPPLGDATPPGCGSIVLAAAIGVWHMTGYAEALLQAIGAARSATERVTRHALVQPALAHVPAADRDVLLSFSPLTALLTRPPAGKTREAILFARTMLRDPHGRKLLERVLGQPGDDTAVREWHATLLNQLRLDDEVNGASFVIDVYETVVTHHQARALAQMRAAMATLTRHGREADEQADARLRDAISVARWWDPLRAIDRSARGLLRQRRYLDFSYRTGIRLCNDTERLTGASLWN